MTYYPRDMRGYGHDLPDPRWPDNAAIAVQFVVNYEEGGENNILHGDAASEAFLSEIVGSAAWPGQRHANMESIYEYGARAGFWRLWRIFTRRNLPVTVYGVATALMRAPDQVAAMLDADWEIASHGLKWIDYKDATPQQERADLDEAIRLHRLATGTAPKGLYIGRTSINTLDIAAGYDFFYSADAYADDLPYWRETMHGPQLIVPYTLDANDMRFATPQGFNSGDQFFAYLRDSFDTLYAEGLEGAPKMMSIGLHCRLSGRPGRAAALNRFLDHIQSHDRVWVTRRLDIAEHWCKHHPHQPFERPSAMDKAGFVKAFGGIYEHSDWVAARAFEREFGPTHDSADGVHALLTAEFRAASPDERLGVLNAHPDLAGKLAAAGELTDESTNEQASAGLDHLTASERDTFTRLNASYVERFRFPFIMAVKGRTRDDILSAFQSRLDNDRETEFKTACQQVERIARLRLQDILPGKSTTNI